jgi:hypothetical protein
MRRYERLIVTDSYLNWARGCFPNAEAWEVYRAQVKANGFLYVEAIAADGSVTLWSPGAINVAGVPVELGRSMRK